MEIFEDLMKKKYDTISSELVRKNPFWDYKLDKYVLPDGSHGEYHYVNSRGATMIIPVDDNNTFTMVRQYRYLNKRHSVEFPGGGIKQGLTPYMNAKEELAEETGIVPGNMKLIGEYNPYNGVTNEICYIYYATGLTAFQSQPEPSEEIEIVRLTGEQIVQHIKQGEIWDGMTLAAWAIYIYQNL